jgi:uncharacterized RDD family membrane protein YckC
LPRIAAVLYDVFLLLAIWFAATLLILPFNHGQAFNSSQWFYPVYLLAVALLFYAWFWTHGGQTLGLRAWRMRLIACDGGPVSLRAAVIRFFCALLSWACLGLGFIWCLWDKRGQCWHDYASQTHLLQLPKKSSDAS